MIVYDYIALQTYNEKMNTVFRFLVFVVVLNVIRYIVGSPIEALTIMDKMYRIIGDYPTCFDTQFSGMDYILSFLYNFMMWLAAAWIFYMAWPAVTGSWMQKSFKIYGVVCLFFISLAAIYMNHYTAELREFYLFSMADALIIFAIVATANGFLFPLFFKSEIKARQVL